jgi:hypothetical protein
MQPEVAGGETMSFPSTTSARIEDAPEVQAVGRLFAPVACAELSVSTATSASRRQALTRSRWPQYRTARAWREITRTAWAARLIFSSAEAYFWRHAPFLTPTVPLERLERRRPSGGSVTA